MAYQVVGRVADRIIRETGARIIPRVFKSFRKRDIAIHTQVFGRSGGRGVRHGRDIGLASSDYISKWKDSLDVGTGFQPQYSSRKFNKARSGRGYRRGSSRRGKYCSRCNCNPKS